MKRRSVIIISISAFFLILAIIIFGIVLYSEDVGAKEDRKANEFEFTYSYLASDLELPEICEKISPNAFLTAGFNPRGYQISYTKSDCYDNLALKTGNSDYCTHVIEKKAFFLDGDELTEKRCRERLESGTELNRGGGDFELILRFSGYQDGDLRQINAVGDEYTIDWIDFWFIALGDQQFKDRALLLPDFSTNGPAINNEFSYENLGCDESNEFMWYCILYVCLLEDDGSYRGDCMEVAKDIENTQKSPDYSTPPIVETIYNK